MYIKLTTYSIEYRIQNTSKNYLHNIINVLTLVLNLTNRDGNNLRSFL
jgi:hypothetical protein